MIAIIHCLGLVVALLVQMMTSPLAASWLLFHLAACAALLYSGQNRDRGLVWWACLAWLLAISASTFLITPILGASAYGFILAAMPMTAMCVDPDRLRSYLIGFGAVVVIFALNLIMQQVMNLHYIEGYDFEGYAWPLLDPNCAAAILNMGMIPAFWLAIRERSPFKRLNVTRSFGLFIFMLLAYAMVLTHSKAGMLSGAVGCWMIVCSRYGWRWLPLGMIAATLALLLAVPLAPDLILSLVGSVESRLPIWRAALALMTIAPWSGLGLGSFGVYYQQLDPENWYWYAHNDQLQFIVEMGFPAALVFVVLVLTVAATTWRGNIASAATMFAVLLMSMFEFQFYMPALSIAMGLALAHHRINAYR
jgi:O-antigen ligase